MFADDEFLPACSLLESLHEELETHLKGSNLTGTVNELVPEVNNPPKNESILGESNRSKSICELSSTKATASTSGQFPHLHG